MSEVGNDIVVIGGNPVDKPIRWILTGWLLLTIAMPIWIFGSGLTLETVDYVIRSVLGGSFIASGACIYAVWMWRVQLTADLRTRRYVWMIGVLPLLIRREGSLDEFSHLLVHGERRTVGQGGSYVAYHITVERKDGSRRRPSFWFNHAPYKPDVRQIATRLRVPIEYSGVAG